MSQRYVGPSRDLTGSCGGMEESLVTESDDDLSNVEQSAEDSLLARMIAAQASPILWAGVVKGDIVPGAWNVYHTGHLYKGGRRVGAIARELASRGLAELAQRRAGKGFDYLIAMRKTAGEPAKVVAIFGSALASNKTRTPTSAGRIG